MTSFQETVEAFREATSGRASDVPLARSALIVAQSEDPAVEPEQYERELQEIARTLEARIHPSDDPRIQLEAAGTLLFGELGFHGNRARYSEIENLLLHEVIARRTGIPVTLAIIYIEVCQRAGLNVRGVGLPGHVVARLDTDDAEPFFIDVFHGGRLLTSEDCRQVVREIYGRRTHFRDYYLEPITPRQMLQRLLHNLKARALQDGDEDRAGRAIDLLLALFPWELDELRDRGMLRERLGDYPAALDDLQQYVRYRAGARDIETVSEAVRSLRRHIGVDRG